MLYKRMRDNYLAVTKKTGLDGRASGRGGDTPGTRR